MNKIIITRKEDDVIVNIVDTIQEISNGLLVTEGEQEYIIGCIAECKIYNNVETLDNIIIQKYIYTEQDGFTLNINYKPYVSLEQQVEDLKSALIETQNAINMLLGV